MKRIVLILAIALGLGACATPTTTDESLASGGKHLLPSENSEVFMKGISESISDHFQDCGKGLSFTWRALSRRTRADWSRFVAAFH